MFIPGSTFTLEANVTSNLAATIKILLNYLIFTRFG